MLIFLIVLLAPFLRSIKASALPSITEFPNSTSISAPRSAITGCALNCNTSQIALGYISWSQLSITATYTLETVLFIIDNQTNSTRTSTIKNTDINFANISTPTNTNNAGTVTAVLPAGDGNTITATFPSTPYEDYPSTYAFCGTLPTIISGTSTCLTIQSEKCAISGYSASGLNSNNGVFTFPSHPPLSVGVQTGIDLGQDPRGWTYTAIVEIHCDAGGDLLKPLFPDLRVWSCGGVMTCVSPAIALNTALFLTVTSTSHEVGPATPSTTIPQAPAAPQLNLPTSSLVAATPNPPVSNDTPIGNQITSELQQVPNNEPTPAQPTTTSLSPPGQSISPNQSAPSDEPAANNLPTSAPPAVQPLEGPNQSAPNNQPAANPPPPPSATIIPVAVTSTNAQGSILVSTSLSPLIPNAPITIVPGAMISASHPVSPITFLPTAITTTNTQGITTTSTGTAAVIPIVVFLTNSHGQVVLSSSLPTAAATVSANVVITSTDAKGSIVSSTAQVPAVILTTTNAQGIQIIITSPITQPSIAIGTSTQDLITGTTNLPILTIGSQTVTANSASQYIVASQTLTPGGDITISGTPISLAPSATALIIGSSTMSLESSAIILPPLMIGTQVVTANDAGKYVVGGLTLTPGGVITVSGTRVSLEAGDTGVVVGTSTEALGALITAGLGSGPGGNGTSGVKTFTGGGVKLLRIDNFSLWLEGLIIVFGMGALMGL